MNKQGPFMTPDQIAELPYRPCVGVMLINPRGHIFVGQRRDSDEPAWQMPQGGVDRGEKTIDAALRELWEETGISDKLISIEAEMPELVRYNLPEHLVGRVWKGRYRGQEQKWFLFRFHGSDDDIDLDTEHPEFSEWRWLPKDEVLEQIVPFKREVYAKVLDAFANRL